MGNWDEVGGRQLAKALDRSEGAVDTGLKESNPGVLGGKRRGRKRTETQKGGKPEKGGKVQKCRHRFLM